MTGRSDKAAQPLSAEQTHRLLRWRMALGRYSEKQLGSSGLSADDLRRDQLLELDDIGREEADAFGGFLRGHAIFVEREAE